jgi:hypothetical protein
LIYSYIVNHYTWVRSADHYEILEETPPGQSTDTVYWRRKLGDAVDLGFVPSVATLSSYRECSPGAAGCEEILVVRYPESVLPRKAAFVVETKAGEFRVLFNLDQGKREYVFHLERLWFWKAAGAAARGVRLQDPGAELTVEHRLERRPVLY